MSIPRNNKVVLKDDCTYMYMVFHNSLIVFKYCLFYNNKTADLIHKVQL